MSRRLALLLHLIAGMTVGFASAALGETPSDRPSDRVLLAQTEGPVFTGRSGQPPDSDFYRALARAAREDAASYRRTAERAREDVRRYRENAERYRERARGYARDAREAEQDHLARDFEAQARVFEARARFAEEQAVAEEAEVREIEGFARRADERARYNEERAGLERAEEEQEGRRPKPAVLVHPDTVFHRLYIIGDSNDVQERQSWLELLSGLRAVLEGDGAQAEGSTVNTVGTGPPARVGTGETTWREQVEQAILDIKLRARSGDEVTIYYSGHGGGGAYFGSRREEEEKDEEYDEHLNGGAIYDDDFGRWFAGFADDVSITVLLDSCFGGGFADGNEDVLESDLVQVIGVNTSCPSTSGTLTEASVRGITGEADYDENGIVTAEELKGFLGAEGWELGAPYDDVRDGRDWEERGWVLGEDFQSWFSNSRVAPADELPNIRIAEDSPELCRFGEAVPTLYGHTPVLGGAVGLGPIDKRAVPPGLLSGIAQMGGMTPVPVVDRPLGRAEIREIQVMLASLGYDPGPPDGLMGARTGAAIRGYQLRVGLPPDGSPTAILLDALRQATVSAPLAAAAEAPETAESQGQEQPATPPADDGDTPEAAPMVTIFVKATESVLDGSGQETVQDVAGQQVKLFAPSTTDVALPGPGVEKDQTDHDQEPIQGVTGEDGGLVFSVLAGALGLTSAVAGKTYEINLVGSGDRGSKTVKINVRDAASALLSLPVALLDYVEGAPQILAGAAFVSVVYPAGEEGVIDGLIEQIIGLLGVEVNICRIKEPAPGLDWSAGAAADFTPASAGPEPVTLILSDRAQP